MVEPIVQPDFMTFSSDKSSMTLTVYSDEEATVGPYTLQMIEYDT